MKHQGQTVSEMMSIVTFFLAAMVAKQAALALDREASKDLDRPPARGSRSIGQHDDATDENKDAYCGASGWGRLLCTERGNFSGILMHCHGTAKKILAPGTNLLVGKHAGTVRSICFSTFSPVDNAIAVTSLFVSNRWVPKHLLAASATFPPGKTLGAG